MGMTFGNQAKRLTEVIRNLSADEARRRINVAYLRCSEMHTWQHLFKTFTLQTESTYDWRHSQWTLPLTAQVAKLVKVGGLPINLGVGARYYADSPDTGPHGWGARLIVTFVFPKR